jgi:hypothetical protein
MEPYRFKREEFLTQHNLGKALSNILNQELVIGKTQQVPLPVAGSKRARTWDYRFQVENQPTVVEFDGNDHYMNALKIKRDREKDALAKKNGLKVVRWPFWVQMDSQTLKHYMGLDYPVATDFPHGFKGGTKYFPSCFCEKGSLRFLDELYSLPRGVFDAVIESLQVMCSKYGHEWVLSTMVRERLGKLIV